MKQTSRGTKLVSVAAGLAAMMGSMAACGGGAAAPAARTLPDEPGGPALPAPKRVVAADGGDHDDDDADDDGLEVGSTRGSVDPSVVSARLQPRAGAIEACYATQVGRRKWLGGGLELAWDVGADGAIGSVRIASSDLGAWPIEKCVLDVARQISFGTPRGNKPARVTAPLTFSAGVGAVSWDVTSTERALGTRLAKLDGCAKGQAPVDVQITLYLGTRGRVEAVGFASPRGFADAWADCAEKTILTWSLTDPRGKVAKLVTTYRPSDDPPTDALYDDSDDL